MPIKGKSMDSSLLIAAGASFVAGLLGYIVLRLWIKPILGYNLTKRKLDHELTHYVAQLKSTADSDQPTPRKRGDATLQTARKHAMDLTACYGSEIPYWYRLLLDSRKESPSEASGLLTNLSKIQDSERVKSRIHEARKALGLG
jgi:hypothetical protein